MICVTKWKTTILQVAAVTCLIVVILDGLRKYQRAPSEEPQFVDEFFSPLMEAYRSAGLNRFPRTPERKFRSGETPRFLLWSEPFDPAFWNAQLSHVQKGLCPRPCHYTFNVSQMDKVDAVVVYLRGIPSTSKLLQTLAPRDPTQPWVITTFEAPPRAVSIHHIKYSSLNGIFNRTMLYRRDSDVFVPYGFIVRRDEAHLLPASWRIPPLTHPGDWHTRKPAVAFISNCQAKTGRLSYIRQLQKYIPVDIYGSCGNLKCGHSMYVTHKYDPSQHHCLREAGRTYLFYLAFENSFCIDYLTEKVYNLMFNPLVPIVLGSANYSAALPPNSYIDAKQYTPKQLAAKMRFLADNPEEYLKYLAWRSVYQPSTVGGERSFCHLCVRLYDPDFYNHKVIDDFHDWFMTKSAPKDGFGRCE